MLTHSELLQHSLLTSAPLFSMGGIHNQDMGLLALRHTQGGPKHKYWPRQKVLSYRNTKLRWESLLSHLHARGSIPTHRKDITPLVTSLLFLKPRPEVTDSPLLDRDSREWKAFLKNNKLMATFVTQHRAGSPWLSANF